MKNAGAESPKELPTGQDSAETDLKDFLYVDRARISALYAQLFPQGVITSVKTTLLQGTSSDNSLGSDVKIVKFDAKNASFANEGIEHQFDASWSIPIEVLEALRSRSMIRTEAKDMHLGSIVLLDRCLMRIIDYATMRDLWGPALKFFVGKSETVPELFAGFMSDISQMEPLAELLRSIPQALHAHFLSKDGYFWSSLQAAYLTIPSHDIILKHGGCTDGNWSVLGVIDAMPNSATGPDVSTWSAGGATDGVLMAMHGLRSHIGRPGEWAGITPLMIYRKISALA